MVNLLRASLNQSTGSNVWKQIWAKDFQAAFIVAVVSLPLSLGLALASGFPPFAGILSSLIGGLVLSFISGSETAIKGPTSGLGAITLSSVYILGAGDIGSGYAYTLAAIALAGLLQIISALFRMGNLGNFVPSAVVHGILASLGFMMFVKQIPALLGIPDIDITSTLRVLEQLPDLILETNPKIAAIGLGSFGFIIVYTHFFKDFSKSVPSIIPILLIGIPFAAYIGITQDHIYVIAGKTFTIDPTKQLVPMPTDFIDTLRLPNFNKMNEGVFWYFVVLFFLACNIESIVTCKILDQSDARHRQTHFNKDLIAIGIGNIVCGMLGALPLISESKRSMVSLNGGAQSIGANFLHALILGLIFMVFLPIISTIPICILAAYLMYLGLKMTLPKEFSKSYHIGKEQLLVFVIVFLATLKFNFMVAAVLGIIIEFLMYLRPNISLKQLFKSNMEVKQLDGHTYHIKIIGPAIFSNFIASKKQLDRIPFNVNIEIDFKDAFVVDHSFLENLSHYDIGRRQQGGHMELKGFDLHTQVSQHPLATRSIVQNQNTARQKRLQQYALESGMSFSANQQITQDQTYPSLFHNRIKILKQENALSCQIENLTFEFKDLLIELQSVNTQTTTLTLLEVAELPKHIPDFLLYHEGFQGQILQSEQNPDINYEAYPAFSHYYYLSGNDTTKTRAFFNNHELIKFLEHNKGYHIVKRQDSLFMYKRVDILNTDEMERMITFALNLVDILTTSNLENNKSYPYLF